MAQSSMPLTNANKEKGDSIDPCFAGANFVQINSKKELGYLQDFIYAKWHKLRKTRDSKP